MEELVSEVNVLEVSAKQNSVDNITLLEEMKKKAEDLFKRQQINAKIAQDMGVKHRALNNTFLIREELNKLGKKLEIIDEKINKEILDDEEMKSLSEIIIKVSTLMNYLNNPKSRVQGIKLDRFSEMVIVEENELKRQIWAKVMKTKAGAELKVLDADEEDLDDCTLFERFIGLFTHKKELDETERKQIEFKREEVKKIYNKEWGMEKSYSIHETIAAIKMFFKDNKDDYELLDEEFAILKNIEKELRKNFIVSDEKVHGIIIEKERRLLPLDPKELSKKEVIEINAYRFLSRNGYDKMVNEETSDYEYADTMANEIKRITDYIDVSM